MSKRIKFIISSLILSLGLILIQFVNDSAKFTFIYILTFLSTLLTAWSLKEGLGKNMTLVTMILPTLFTLGVGTFWFLLPSNLFTRIPMVGFYLLGIYVLFTTMNIYTVSSQKTIALLRAARGVGFVLTLVTSFLIYDAVLSLRLNPLFSGLFIFVSSFFIYLQGFWSIELEKEYNWDVLKLSLISSLITLEFAVMIFFWPVTIVVGSLFLTSGVYLLLGLGQSKIEDRLFPSVIREYLTVGLIVLLGMFFATRWGG